MGRINNTIDRLIFQCRRKDRDLDAVKRVAWELVQQLRKAQPKPAAADKVGKPPAAQAGDTPG